MDKEILPIATKIGEHEAEISALKNEVDSQKEEVKRLKAIISAWNMAIGKCTAIWGFIMIIVTAIGGFVSYNFVKVKLAIIAAFRAFYSS